jgi:hypothetical protein
VGDVEGVGQGGDEEGIEGAGQGWAGSRGIFSVALRSGQRLVQPASRRCR